MQLFRSVPFVFGFLFLVPASAQECTQAVEPPADCGIFGTAVDVDGTQAVVSAVQSFGVYGPGGIAFIYEQNPTSQAFLRVGSVRRSDLTSGDQFGHRVELDGDVLAVANVRADIGGFADAGAVYLFERDAGTGLFEEVQKLNMAAPALGDDFGQDIALDGNRLVIGVPERGTNGVVRVYVRNAGTGVWELEQELLPAGTTGNFVQFGAAVALEGDRLMVGVPRNMLTSVGAVIAYERNTGTGVWEYQQTLEPSAVQPQRFGLSIELEGNRIVAGAPSFSSALGSAHGRAYIFDRDVGTGVWSESAVLQAASLNGSDLAGSSLALQGDEAFVAATNKERPNTNGRGVVHRFAYDPGAQIWNELAAIEPTYPNTTFFGQGLAVDGPVLSIGSPAFFDGAFFRHALSPDCNGNGVPDICEVTAGTAIDTDGDYLLDECESVGISYCGPAVPNSTGFSGTTAALGNLAPQANDIILRAEQLPTNAFGFFITSKTQGFVMNPGGSSGNLCILGLIGRYVGPGQIQSTGAASSFSLVLDLTQVPQPTGFVAAVPGETWNFQAWYRDGSPQGPTSNFTDGLSVTFQ